VSWDKLARVACKILMPQASLNLSAHPIPLPLKASIPSALVSDALPLLTAFKRAPHTARSIISQFLIQSNETALAHLANFDFQLASLPVLKLDSTVTILFVNNAETLARATRALLANDVVGVDSEFFPHNRPSAVIVQVATRRNALVFDLKFAPCIDVLAKLFSDPSVMKIGHAFNGDMQMLYTTNRKFDRCESVIDTSELFFTLFPSVSLRQIGLARLTALFFGQRLDKREQMSNWSMRPLTSSQMHYAALDARVLIDLVDVMQSHPSFPATTLHSLATRWDAATDGLPSSNLNETNGKTPGN